MHFGTSLDVLSTCEIRQKRRNREERKKSNWISLIAMLIYQNNRMSRKENTPEGKKTSMLNFFVVLSAVVRPPGAQDPSV